MLSIWDVGYKIVKYFYQKIYIRGTLRRTRVNTFEEIDFVLRSSPRILNNNFSLP